MKTPVNLKEPAVRVIFGHVVAARPTEGQLSQEVERLMSEGWRCSGAAFYHNDDRSWRQTMVRP